MTDLNVAPPPAATVLAGFLASAGPQFQTSVYHGVLTPTQLDVRSAEIEALTSFSAVHDLGWLRRYTVRGKDRFRWLSGMVTNMVKDLAPGAGAWNLVLNVQGRIQGDLTVWRESDDLELEVTADQADKLLAHLDHFIIMDDVELGVVEDQTAIGLTGPKAAEVLGRLGLPVLPEPMTQVRTEWTGCPRSGFSDLGGKPDTLTEPARIQLLLRRGYGVLSDHYTLWLPAAKVGDLWQSLGATGAKPVGAAALDALRIAEGVPAYGVDIVDRDLPQETSQLRALHFNKGCYLGQEIVERIRSRGNVHRHLRSLELDGPLPEPGAKLTLGDAESGHITSAADLPLPGETRRFAIGMIRGEAEERNLPLSYSVAETSGSATILAGPPHFPPGVER